MLGFIVWDCVNETERSSTNENKALDEAELHH